MDANRRVAAAKPGRLRRSLRLFRRRFAIASDLVALYRLRTSGFLRQAGWFPSYRHDEPRDAHGRPLPWLTYASIWFLQGRIRPDMHVFEYGCGCSTLWWAERVASVTACEHDRRWYLSVQRRLPANATVFHVDLEPDGEYARSASEQGKRFDVIVIDGRDRVHCAKRSLEALAPQGVFVWDNSDKTKYRPGFEWLRERGFRQLDFRGMGPLSTLSWQTSIFYRRDNCLGL